MGPRSQVMSTSTANAAYPHGFRALAFVNGGGTRLVSRRGLEYRRFDDLRSEMSLELNADDAVVDGEIVKLDAEGRPIFVDLMRRRGPLAFVAFDVLAANGKDLRKLPLIDRKKILRGVLPKRSSVILFPQHIANRGREFFAAVCAQDLEGIVAKRKEWAVRPEPYAVVEDQRTASTARRGSGTSSSNAADSAALTYTC
jgi:ATP-dependent DNA ligase